MNEVSLKPVIEELENLFSKFNARFFADKLERAYPDSCYLIGQDTMGYFILRTK